MKQGALGRVSGTVGHKVLTSILALRGTARWGVARRRVAFVGTEKARGTLDGIPSTRDVAARVDFLLTKNVFPK